MEDNTKELKEKLAELETEYAKVSEQYFGLQDQITDVKEKLKNTGTAAKLLGKYVLYKDRYMFVQATKYNELNILSIIGPAFLANPSEHHAALDMRVTLHVNKPDEITVITEDTFFDAYDKYAADIKEILEQKTGRNDE